MSPTRREFARTALGLAAAPLALGARPAPLEARPSGTDRRPSGVEPARGLARSPVPFVDGLSFLPEDPETALPASGLSAFVLDVSAGEVVEEDGQQRFRRTFDATSASMVATRRRLRELDGVFLATRGSSIREAWRDEEVAVFFQLQGCEPLEGRLERMDLFHELGLRLLQITHHHDNAIGGGALEPRPTGLTDLGFEAVERMDALGIVPDLSHASDPTSMDVLRASGRPVVVSHGAARALVPNARCTPDEVIRGVADSGGVMGIFMMSFWLTTDPVPGVEHLVRQIRHVADVGGIDAVGIANDYPVTGEATLAALGNDNARGVVNYHPWWRSQQERGITGFDELPRHVVIPELNDVRRMYTIHDALGDAGFTADEVEKVLGGNWIRVLGEALG